MTNSVQPEILAANRKYAEGFGDKADLQILPRRKFLILTCMDARLDPAKFAGLAEGDAHVFRNAGGRVTDDAIRSLVISHKLLGTQEWFVIHHTDCGMEYTDDHHIATLLEGNLESVTIDHAGFHNTPATGGSTEGHYVHWLTFKDREKSVLEDVLRLRHHPLVPANLPIYGYIYDVKTGKLNPVAAAIEAGKAR